jgi:hypothetical protein
MFEESVLKSPFAFAVLCMLAVFLERVGCTICLKKFIDEIEL